MTIEQTITSLGLGATIQFVPLSQSRNADEKYPSLNYKVTLCHHGRPFLTLDYMMGAAHAPAWSHERHGVPLWRHNALLWECEHGRKADLGAWERGASRNVEGPHGPRGEPINPNMVDVFYSVISDCDAIEYGTFEEWAETFGYDTDSRNAEKIYRQCLEHALTMRATIGEHGLNKLREAFADY